MANYLAIPTVTEALRLRLFDAVGAVVNGADVAARRPAATDGDSQGLVTVFLYRVTPDPALRNADLPTRDADGVVRRRPGVALNLRYLLSFSGDDAQLVPQRMLATTMALLHSEPALTRAELDAARISESWLVASDLPDDPAVRFTLDDLSVDDLSKLWSVLVQVPYRLSVGYTAGVVLVEADVPVAEALPVRQGRTEAMPARQPVITRVRAADGVPGRLEISGRDLLGPGTAVRFDGGDPRPAETATAGRIVAATGDLPAGVHGVQVVHEVPLGDPSTPHRAVESATAGFVRRPVVTVLYDPAGPAFDATFAPPLAARQRVALLLNEYTADGPRFYRLAPAETLEHGTATLRFARGAVAAGTYLVRAQVDGAESLLDFTAPGPLVVVP
jgi:hypothetical protein